MSNSLSTVAELFTQKLDELIVAELKTGDLTINQDYLGDFAGVGKVNVAKIALDGLGTYSRSTGFPAGDLTLSWETLQLTYDRGRAFSIDAMDDEERELVVSANAMGEFVRTKVAPEVDAIRFAKLFAAASSASHTASADLTDKTVQAAILAGEAAVAEEADLDGCILYITRPVLNLLRQAMPYRISAGENPDGRFEAFDDMKVVVVPQARFYSAVTLYDGTTSGQEGGGFIKNATSGKDLNFVIVNPEACSAIQKHQTLRYFAPDTNQAADAHLWQYRLFHDLLVFDNKKTLAYAHTKA